MAALNLASPAPQYALAGVTPGFTATLAEWSANDGERIARLWAHDATLWTGGDEARWLGWLDIVPRLQGGLEPLVDLANELRRDGIRHAVVVGMGGSSLGPDVLRATFGPQAEYPELAVIDSMVPAQIAALTEQLDLSRTVFLIASKSGSTIEPNVLKQFFWDRVGVLVGADRVGRHFVAITDPGTKMEELARRDQFRRTVFGDPTIGGRYSALSPFGMTPAAVMGLDVGDLLARARRMVDQCQRREAASNPGVSLGLALGTLWQAGRDKLTLIASPRIGLLGAWLEQLIAESTGKEGRGIVPIDDEPPQPVEHYANDRLFCYLRLASDPSAEQDARVAALSAAGQPVLVIPIAEPAELGAEFFRWELATAVAGAVLGINPFDQPDVEAAKIAARQVTAAYEASGTLPAEEPTAVEGSCRLYIAPGYSDRLASAGGGPTLVSWLRAHLATLGPGDYFALNAFLPMHPSMEAALRQLRLLVLERRHVATTLGFGPRFLHSTGQLHKGGPESGVFVELTSDDAVDLAIPGQRYSFGVLKLAQAQGDYAVLAERGRRIVRIHLGADVPAELSRLQQWFAEALA